MRSFKRDVNPSLFISPSQIKYEMLSEKNRFERGIKGVSYYTTGRLRGRKPLFSYSSPSPNIFLSATTGCHCLERGSGGEAKNPAAAPSLTITLKTNQS
jgi:hypothetical protein